jgi:hypothetical protein
MQFLFCFVISNILLNEIVEDGFEDVCSLSHIVQVFRSRVLDCNVKIGPKPTLGMRVGVEVVCC